MNDVKYFGNYDFVPYHKPKYYTPSEQNLSGYIELKLECLTDTYIGSGFCGYCIHNNKSGLVRELVKYDGKPTIPGSSLKGAVRTVASTVSDGCLPSPTTEKDKSHIIFKENIPFKPISCKVEYDKNKKEYTINTCIICSMFGTMGLGSKVDFGDFTADSSVSTSITRLEQQFSPHASEGKYNSAGQGKSSGYKFYKTVCRTSNENKDIYVEVINKGSVFKGRIFFKNLSEKQLELLMFSLGLDNSFTPKIGGWKNSGLGAIRLSVDNFKLNSKNKSAKEYAAAYEKNVDNDCRERIEKLREILSPIDNGDKYEH